MTTAVKELSRKKTNDGETIVEYETDKAVIRLIATYGSKNTLEDMIYHACCRRLSERLS